MLTISIKSFRPAPVHATYLYILSYYLVILTYINFKPYKLQQDVFKKRKNMDELFIKRKIKSGKINRYKTKRNPKIKNNEPVPVP